MPLYDKPVRALLPEMILALAPAAGDVFTREQALAWFDTNYPKIKNGTVAAHLIRFTTNARSRLHYGARLDEDLLYQIEPGRFRRYERSTDPLPIHAPGPGKPEEVDQEVGDKFAYETDLRDYLSGNLSLIEPGLQLYQEEGITGVEFPAGGRFIDILALDDKQRLVVIELKVSRGYDRVVGQLLRYMAWIRENQADSDQGVRGIILAREISGDLKLACSLVPDVSLFEYQLSVRVTRVAAGDA